MENILKSIEKGKAYSALKAENLKIGVSALPPIQKDSTDRNRTSPFAFTGNKFEFRMVGSATNIACPNFIINTIVADELCGFADELEKAQDFNAALDSLLRRTIKKHKRIIFAGNNYSKEWEKEAAKRGLLNYKTTVDALPHYADAKNIKLFKRRKVLSESEIRSRMEILLENYANIVHIEAFTALDIARKEIAPAVIGYQSFIIRELNEKKALGDFNCELEKDIIKKISVLSGKFAFSTEKLEKDLEGYDKTADNLTKALYCKDKLLADMEEVRKYADDMELILSKKFSPFPTYEDILYSVKY